MLAVIVALAAVAATAGMVFAYSNESKARSVSLAVGDAKAVDFVKVDANVVAIDPVKEELTFRLAATA